MPESSHRNDVVIREAVQEDFAEVLELMKEFARFQQAEEKLNMTVEKMVAGKGAFRILVATRGDEYLGYASFFPAWYSWTGRALYLDDLYVRERSRKQGIGRALLEAVIREARSSGCIKLRWQVSRWNQEAIAFYRNMGAEIDDVEWNCDLNL